MSFSMTVPALQVEGLSFTYPGGPSVLNEVNLRLQPGEKVGLVGLNGSGKTTLFLLLCGVLKPTSGEITLFGQQVKPGHFYPDIGLVFQNPDDQLFSARVWDDVAFGPQNMGLSTDEIEQRVGAALSTTGTSNLVDLPPYHLSGGQKRMVAIASVISMRPRLMLYDEPTAFLDDPARQQFIEFVSASPEAALMASHDRNLIRELCSRVVQLREGALSEVEL